MAEPQPPGTGRCDEALDGLRKILPFAYAQWVVESPLTRDYDVVASRCPAGTESYDVAHRPGVIGQVFRRGRAIFLPRARAHPLYDLYDPRVEWELALPLREGDNLAAVLNLEGGGRLELDLLLWERLGQSLLARTGLALPAAPPEPGEAWMVHTTRVEIYDEAAPSAAEAALRLGRAAARAGLSLLVAGELGLPDSATYPSVASALAAGLPLGGCFRGGTPRLDFLETGALTAPRGEDLPWWPLADGRYDFVLLASCRS
jgi:hypothetical protein